MIFKNMGLLTSLISQFIISAIIWNYYRNKKYSEIDKYHTIWPRFWAPTIDEFILYPITIIVFYIQLNNLFEFKDFTILSFIQNTFTYMYIIFMHGKYGKTFGKMACKVRVVDYKTGQPISFKQAIIRDIIPVVFLSISTVLILFYNPLQGATLNAHQQTENTYFHIIQTIAGSMFALWFLAEIITMLTNSKRRALHDFIAGTVVVRTNIISEEDRTPHSLNSEPNGGIASTV
jgi:uncharacterized RDD family membrane protein YckC